MMNTLFLALPSHEQEALLRALRRAGIKPGRVCVSRLEQPLPLAHGAAAFTAISTPSWTRTYAAGDWIGLLERELAQAA